MIVLKACFSLDYLSTNYGKNKLVLFGYKTDI